MTLRFNRRFQICTWLMLSGGLLAWWSHVFFQSNDKTALLPGTTSHGHYQIELKCSACHDTRPDGLLDSAVSNQACLQCHDIDLEEADDSHPAIKFKKPENLPFMEKIDARRCITCHTEHKPGQTTAMGVTIPGDYCLHCHQSTVEERETHRNLAFNSCATSGCHNFHDNRALYERHLAIHSMQPPHLPGGAIAPTDRLKRYLEAHPNTLALSTADADAPKSVKVNPQHLSEWSMDAHARAGINCSSCHQPDQKPWNDRVDMATCAQCHESEHSGFLRGKHGMRLALGLDPMQPSMARQPMNQDSAHRSLDCNSCHGSHDFDTRQASYQACIQCHNDAHSQAYQDSPHHRAWQRELTGEAAAGTGVSCATCHMPRLDDNKQGRRVEHNQNANLTPNEKMLRPICQECHGLPFAIDALADRDLIQRNFNGQPSIHVPSVDWARERAISRDDKEIIELIRKMSGTSTPPSNPSPETNNPKPQ